MPSDVDIPKKTTSTVINLLSGFTFTSTEIEYNDGRKEITQEITQSNK